MEVLCASGVTDQETLYSFLIVNVGKPLSGETVPSATKMQHCSSSAHRHASGPAKLGSISSKTIDRRAAPFTSGEAKELPNFPR